ncbi:MAG: TolC family protein [Flavobacterium nitrogenifigens]|uniref:TolC family protein n=1 Tax=Flavobacterium nitrogenifigens TaxID=1617283 RepID=UPI0028072B32|nr:TolC family protein [Flavobacterium nitrogenifigens]MDQ8013928.1 TolC family protein [Flavobacterium nitrogenifigens]
MKKRIALICLALLCLVPKLMAQKIWTLKDCIAYGRKRSFRAEENTILNATYTADKKNIEALYLPQFNAVLNPSYTKTPGNYILQSGLGLEVNAILYSGSRKKNELQKADMIVAQSEYNIASAQNDIELQVLYAYTDALSKKEQFLVGVGFYQEALKLRQKLSEKKTLPVAAQIFFDAILEQDQHGIESLNLQYELALVKIKQLINLENSSFFDIEEIPPFTPAFTELTEAFPKAILADPAISSNQIQVSIATKNIAIAKSFLSPAISFQGSSFYAFNDPNNLSGVQHYLGLRVAIPILNVKGQNANIERAVIDFNYQKTQLENQKKTLFNTMVFILKELKNKETVYQNILITLDKTTFLLNETTKDLEAGNSTYEAYLISRNWNKQNALQAVVLKYETITQAKLLDFYTGTTL